MEHTPETWHYGLIARWWAEFNTAKPEELDFYGGVIRQYGEPALDLACGTGRLLIPLREMGLEVEGCDISQDMLTRCRDGLECKGLAAHLHCEAFHEFDLPRRYRTIFICDSFGIGGSREQDLEGLRRVYQHLEPGGALALSNWLPYGNEKLVHLWTAEGQKDLPQPWPESGSRKQAADGDEIELRSRIFALDPLSQKLTIQMKALLWHASDLVNQEERTLQENLYFHNELQLMLESAGFASVDVQAGYHHGSATAKDPMLTYVATKSSTSD